MLCCFLVESSPNLLKMQDEVFSCLSRVWEVRFSAGLTPVLVRRQPSSEATNNPSTLDCFFYLGRAPTLVYVRPSNEALLRARVPGAQDQRGCPSNPFCRGGSASKRIVLTLPLLLHDVYDQTRQWFREEVRRFVGHAFAGCCDGLYFANFCRIEQEGSGSHSLRYPIQGFMVILRIEDGLLFLLRRAERRDDELLE